MEFRFDTRKLVRLRKDRFWTQEDLAAASGLSVRTIQRIETSGKASPESCKMIAAAFDISPQSLSAETSRYSKTEKRNILLGTLGGVTGGLMGCAGGWYGVWKNQYGLGDMMTHHPVMTVYLIIMTGICLSLPVVVWRRYLR